MSNNTLNLILASNQPVLFKTLLEKDDIDYKEVLYYLLRNTSVKVAKNQAIVRSVYTRLNFNKRKKLKLLTKSSESDFVELFRLLLDEMKDYTNIKELLNTHFIIVSKKGSVEVVKLLLADSRVDPNAKNDSAIKLASLHGHVEVVRLLLADLSKRADPSASDNNSIRMASKYGCTEVVRLLLADPRVDPNVWDNNSIKSASHHGHIEIVNLLLADPRVDPSDSNNWAIQIASQNGHIEIVKLLLADSRVDPSDSNNESIRQALLTGRTEIIRLLSLHTKISHPEQLDVDVLTTIVENWLVWY